MCNVRSLIAVMDVKVACFWGFGMEHFLGAREDHRIVVGRCHHAALLKGHALITVWT